MKAQAWIVVKEHFEGKKLMQRFIGLFDASISSNIMLALVESLYKSYIPNSKVEGRATHRYLNDGSPYTDKVICGHLPSLHASRAYDIVFSSTEDKDHIVSWREPHVLVKEGVWKVEYWEQFTVHIQGSERNDIVDESG